MASPCFARGCFNYDTGTASNGVRRQVARYMLPCDSTETVEVKQSG